MRFSILDPHTPVVRAPKTHIARRGLTSHRYPNLYEVRLIPTKKDIAFVEYVDEGSATVAKDALHNYKLDGENKIKVRLQLRESLPSDFIACLDYIREEVSCCMLRVYCCVLPVLPCTLFYEYAIHAMFGGDV